MATPALNFGQPVSGQGITRVTPNFFSPKNDTGVKNQGVTNLFSDEQQKYNQMKADGLDDSIARQLITKKRQTLLKDITSQEKNVLLQMQKDGLDSETAVKVIKENRYKNLPLWKKALKVPFDASLGVLTLATEQVGNLFDFATAGQVPYFKEQVQSAQDIASRQDSTAFQAGRNILGTGEMLAMGPSKIAPTLGGRTLQGAALGGSIGAGSPILEKGADVTPGEIVKGGAIGAGAGAVLTPVAEKVAAPIIGGVITKGTKYGTAGIKGGVTGLGKSVGRDIKRSIITPFKKSAQDKAGNIALGGLINPAKLDAVKKGLMVDEGVATPQDVGKWMLDRIKPGNKQQIADQLIKHSETSKKAVDNALIKIPDTFENQTAKKALTQILNDLEGRVGFEDDAIRIAKLLDKDKYTLTELNAIKREMDKIYNIYKQSGEVSASLNAQGLNKVRQEIRKFIEEQGKKYGVDIRKLNNETSVARGLAEGIMKKDNADNVREFLSGFAPTGVGSVIGAGQSIAQGNDPLIVLRDALIGGATAKILTSTKVRTTIADKLNKLGPKEMSALEKYIKSGGADEVGRKVAEKVIPQKLLPAGGQSSYKGKAIVTPQTAEKGIIQESKLPLKKTKYGTNNSSSSNSNNTSVLLKPTPKVIKKPQVIKGVDKKAIQTNLSKLNKSNIDEIASKITTDKTKLAQVKQVIQDHIKKYGEEFKEYMAELVDKIAEKVGARTNLLPTNSKQVSKVSDDLINIDKDLIFEYTKSGGGEKVMPIIKQKQVSKELSKLPNNKETVYSGQKMTLEQLDEIRYAKNDIWTNKRLISSSTDRNVAQSFADYNPKNKNKIMLEFDGGGKDISQISRYSGIQNEKEILFPIGTKFKVVELGDNNFKLTPIYEQANKPIKVPKKISKKK